MKQKKIEFANFVCTAGDKKLLDLFFEVIKPAFFHDYTKRYGSTKYSFYDVKLVNIGNEEQPSLAIAGKIVRDMIISIEQKRSNQGALIPAKEKHDSSPSSQFVLYLDDHRMIFLREHASAPSLKNFKSVISTFISRKHNSNLQEKEKELKNQLPRKDWASSTQKLWEENPPPIVNIIPIQDEQNFFDAIFNLTAVTKIILYPIKTNDEMDIDSFFEGARNVQEELGGVDKAKIEFSAKEGKMQPAKVAELAKTAVKDQNVIVKVVGRSGDASCSYSNSLDEQNSSMSLNLTENISANAISPENLSAEGRKRLTRLSNSGRIKIIQKPQEVIEKIRNIFRREKSSGNICDGA